ncbi:VOC family protein [Hymenobacter guriensis]|uniref:VOC family protein n=1 Tax=Hymenobacter guriensis TaxID=2793065 RepID=A0ABS0L1P1_9BACT|nr:VOC family protein [Hymenobacter guriensis]MBG8554033.1 VOC family protein [Hymenobacter guriensis]
MNLNQLTVPSRNLPVAVAFYQRLGLHLIVDAQPRYARFECPEGDATFSLHHAEELPVGSGIWIYFECADLDERVCQLQAAGLMFDELPTDQPWLWREARLTDPDGHQLILYHAGKNRKNPPWRVTGAGN